MTEVKNNRKISKNVILLGIVSFLTDLSSEIIFPILPMFIASLGGGGLVIGLIGGLADSISSLLKVFSGYLSDRAGKRLPFVFGGYALSSISKIILSFSSLWQHVALLVSVERIGKGLRSAPRDAIIAESSRGQRGKAFGIHRAMDTSGAVAGSGISFVLFYFIGLSFETIILAAGVIGFLALLPLLLVKEKNKKPVESSLKISLKELPRDFKIFLIIAAIFALGNFTYMLFILKAQAALSVFFDPVMAIALPILLYVWFNLIYAVFSIPAGVLSDRLGRRGVLAAGYALFALTCAGFMLSDSLILFIVFFAIYGVTYALIDGNQRAYASDLIPGKLRGTGLGAFHTAIGLAALPASLIAGVLWELEYLGSDAVFIYGAALGLVAAALLLLTGSFMHRANSLING